VAKWIITAGSEVYVDKLERGRSRWVVQNGGSVHIHETGIYQQPSKLQETRNYDNEVGETAEPDSIRDIQFRHMGKYNSKSSEGGLGDAIPINVVQMKGFQRGKDRETWKQVGEKFIVSAGKTPNA
jgi:hypothetical protein